MADPSTHLLAPRALSSSNNVSSSSSSTQPSLSSLMGNSGTGSVRLRTSTPGAAAAGIPSSSSLSSIGAVASIANNGATTDSSVLILKDGIATSTAANSNNNNNDANAAVPLSPYKKWLILAMASFVLFGTYFGYDNPSALNTQLQSYLNEDYDTWQYQFNILYSVYSLPNIFLPFFGGAFVDRMGNGIALVTFSTFVCMGQAIFAIGIQSRSFWVMVLGRILFGIGGESLSVVQSAVVGQWWADSKLGFALGILLSIARLGSVANDSITPMVADWWSVPMAAWFGFLMCTASTVSCVGLAVLARRPPPSPATVALKPHQASTNKLTDTASETVPLFGRGSKASSYVSIGEHTTSTGSPVANSQLEKALLSPQSPPSDHDGGSITPPDHPHVTYHSDTTALLPPAAASSDNHTANGVTDGSMVKSSTNPMDALSPANIKTVDAHHAPHPHDIVVEEEIPTRLSDIRLFKLPFWLLCGICICLYGTVIPWHSIASDLLQDRWYPKDAQRAGVMLGIPDTISAVASPFFGLAVDYFGRRGTSMMVCSLTLATVHTLFALTSFTPIPSLTALGLGYAIYAAAIWPAVAFLAPHGRLGMSYGISTAALNLSLTIFPLVVAWLRGSYGWTGVELFFAGLASAAMMLCIWLMYVDHTRYAAMLDSPAERAVALRKSAIASRTL